MVRSPPVQSAARAFRDATGARARRRLDAESAAEPYFDELRKRDLLQGLQRCCALGAKVFQVRVFKSILITRIETKSQRILNVLLTPDITHDKLDTLSSSST